MRSSIASRGPDEMRLQRKSTSSVVPTRRIPGSIAAVNAAEFPPGAQRFDFLRKRFATRSSISGLRRFSPRCRAGMRSQNRRGASQSCRMPRKQLGQVHVEKKLSGFHEPNVDGTRRRDRVKCRVDFDIIKVTRIPAKARPSRQLRRVPVRHKPGVSPTAGADPDPGLLMISGYGARRRGKQSKLLVMADAHQAVGDNCDRAGVRPPRDRNLAILPSAHTDRNTRAATDILPGGDHTRAFPADSLSPPIFLP